MDKIPTTPGNGQPMYTLVKDKYNVEHKVVNFNNPEMVKTSGSIIIEAIRKGQTRHAPSSNFRVYRDPITEIIWGVPEGTNQQGDILFRLFSFGDYRHYDLSLADDRKEWAVMQHHPLLLGSPFLKGKPAFKKVDVEQDAVAKVKKIGEREAAYAIIRNLSHLQLIDMARNCDGIDILNNSMIVIQSKLYDYADNKPEDFNRIWSMSNRESLTVFKRCLLTGLVHLDPGIGYLWKKATQLGNSESSAIDFITKNHTLLMAMDAESKLLDNQFQATASEEEKASVISVQPEAPKVVTDADLYQKELEKRLFAQEDQLTQQSKKMDQLLEMLSNNKNVLDKDAPVPVPEAFKQKASPDSVSEEELKALQFKAQAMGMKHAKVTKDPAKINAWIEANSVKG